jgi:hypothetical protein
MEVGPQTRKLLLHTKIKLGWQICSVGNYLVAKQCYNCSKHNHRQREFRSTITCPLCTGSHSLKDCPVNPHSYKCVNCLNFNKHNKSASINDNHSALDRKCPSLKAILEKTNTILATGMNTKASHLNKSGDKSDIRCIQLNLRHSRAATSNLMKIVAENDTDILFIQEPYTIQGKLIG